MLFNSFEYFILLIGAALFTPLLPIRFRIATLLVVSYYFYSFWSVKFTLLIATVTLVSYGLAIGISRKNRGVFYLLLGIIINIGVLIYFKYTNFFIEIINNTSLILGVGQQVSPYSIVLPVGISFYVFQVLGYLIDVHNGQVQVERKFTKYCLFVSFFPQLLAGPIERAGRLLPQLENLRRPSRQEFFIASGLIGWGLFKKVVIADNVAEIVNYSFTPGIDGGIATTILGLYSFTVQIFCDFSAYTDIAIGSALLFGIRLVQNFQDPFYATSIRQFWSKWHISLTSWFTDYIYFPLCLNKKLRVSPVVGIIIVFTISGFWHGASWMFIAWGTFHGLLLAMEQVFRVERIGTKNNLVNWLKRLIVFQLIALSWLFFRSDDFSQAWEIFLRLSNFNVYPSDYYSAFILICCAIPLLLSFSIRKLYYADSRNGSISIIGWNLIGWLGLFLAMVFGVDESREFYYFQF